jgi:hypothetical protein
MTDQRWGDARESSARTGGGDRLLPGEDPETPHPDDVQHWIRVYAELLESKTRILDVTLQERQRRTGTIAEDELERDRAIMVAEMERLRRRLQFWQSRGS